MRPRGNETPRRPLQRWRSATAASPSAVFQNESQGRYGGDNMCYRNSSNLRSSVVSRHRDHQGTNRPRDPRLPAAQGSRGQAAEPPRVDEDDRTGAYALAAMPVPQPLEVCAPSPQKTTKPPADPREADSLDVKHGQPGDDHFPSVVPLRKPAARASRRASALASSETTYRTAATARGHPGLTTNQIKTATPNANTANQ